MATKTLFTITDLAQYMSGKNYFLAMGAIPKTMSVSTIWGGAYSVSWTWSNGKTFSTTSKSHDYVRGIVDEFITASPATAIDKVLPDVFFMPSENVGIQDTTLPKGLQPDKGAGTNVLNATNVIIKPDYLDIAAKYLSQYWYIALGALVVLFFMFKRKRR